MTHMHLPVAEPLSSLASSTLARSCLEMTSVRARGEARTGASLSVVSPVLTLTLVPGCSILICVICVIPSTLTHTARVQKLKLKMLTACHACAALVAWAGILSLLASVANFVHLTPDSTRTLESSADVAEQALGVEALSDVRVSHLRELASLSEFTAVFTHLGRRAEYTSIAKLEGNFETRWLPLGVWRSLLLMGGAGGALVEEGGGGGAPAWRDSDSSRRQGLRCLG